jgi:hypothetical protein
MLIGLSCLFSNTIPFSIASTPPRSPAPTPPAGTLAFEPPLPRQLIPGMTIAIKNVSIATLGNVEKVAGGALAADLITGLEGFASFEYHGFCSTSSLAFPFAFLSFPVALAGEGVEDRSAVKLIKSEFSVSSRPISLNTDLLPPVGLLDPLPLPNDFAFAFGCVEGHLSDSRRRSDVTLELKLGLCGFSLCSILAPALAQTPGLRRESLKLDGMIMIARWQSKCSYCNEGLAGKVIYRRQKNSFTSLSKGNN